MRFSPLLLTVAVMALPIAGHARNLACTTQTSASGGWVPRMTIFFIDEDKKTASVLNELTMVKSRQPMRARVRKTRNQTLRINWNVNGLRTKQGPIVTAHFFATFDATLSVVNIKATVGNGINAPSGQGRCVELDQKTLDGLVAGG